MNTEEIITNLEGSFLDIKGQKRKEQSNKFWLRMHAAQNKVKEAVELLKTTL